MTPPEAPSLGELTYEKYRDLNDGMSPVTGKALPPFEALPREIQQEWEMAAAHLAVAVGFSDQPSVAVH